MNVSKNRPKSDTFSGYVEGANMRGLVPLLLALALVAATLGTAGWRGIAALMGAKAEADE